MTLNLIIDSDLHFQHGQIRTGKHNHVEMIIKLHSKNKIDAIICAGDLTEYGTDGKKLLCWQYGGTDDEVSPLENFIKVIENAAPVYICMGNHDNYVPWPYLHKGVRDLVEKRHGALWYSWDLKKEDIIYHFICMDVYPNNKSLPFLTDDLQINKDKTIIIYFHYCLTGEWSDWWTEAEKEAFYNVIKDYNIRLLIVGHRHDNWLDKWKNIDVVSGAGDNVLVCTLDKDKITIQEYNYQQVVNL